MKVDAMDLSLPNSSLMVVTADHERQGQAAHRQYRQITYNSSLQVRAMPEIHSADDFIVKFSPSVL